MFKINKKNLYIMLYVTLFLILGMIIWELTDDHHTSGKKVNNNEIVQKIKKNEIKEITSEELGNKYFQGNVYKIICLTKDNNLIYTKMNNTYFTSLVQNTLIGRHDIIYNNVESSWNANILRILFNIIPLISSIIFVFHIAITIRKQSGKLNSNPLISSKQKSKFTFKDVAGNEEEKEEMQELIDFLKNPYKYEKIGASIPKGVLLEGPPGTGKTLLAKAVAGEARVPFYSASGSEFVEMFVGVGASRIRKLFEEVRNHAPCVLFVDEIDVLGGKRGSGNFGGSQEKDQTLNQLLTEMDGFNSSKGVLIIGATNRKDMLDAALLRPGRFDRQFTVGLPDVKAREAILKVHAKNKKLAQEVDLSQIAKQTPYMSGAQLASVLNEASILTVRNNKTLITNEELYEAIDRVLMGPAKKSRKYDEDEKKMVSYHEAGHAVIGLKLKHAQKVQKVTIIPRGDAGGYNLMLPEKETFFSSKKRMLANIISFLGGRAAEELIFDDISNGAYGDFKSATQIATQMVTKLGMSEIGPVQDTDKKSVDREIKNIIDTCMKEANKIIQENQDLLHKIANLLLKKETITKEEIDKLV
ncbi:ATP-dependent zinc metalloprotease FtsH [Candidatus Phytoplasma meliae]|uniref:ATP-dependent zinc metalloprotease FtsH n=1 Tax=Candidatus Phytoplasma meliae TaxID=1848402 RepID=A0ABS5CZ77_9MOLU|nr:ATP-dependent zinc metalloprotease FtsH [Candidatus Phytoplasma meliae]MBP5836279.1 ATP-dependent zinc metalloprotease FtsH [Candidatus Phytoplasma meliae]